MRVKNINEIRLKKCRCGSWLKHWQKYSHEKLPVLCPVNGCFMPPDFTAFVQEDGYINDEWFVVPLCATHSSQEGGYLDLDRVALVPADVSKTCGK
jgi:hypothetical protein